MPPPPQGDAHLIPEEASVTGLQMLSFPENNILLDQALC